MTEITSKPTRATPGDRHVVQYDRLDDESLSVTVAEAVATVVGTDVTELEPLHYAINTDALERLFEPRANGLRSGGSVSFEYCDCIVSVTAEGEISVEPVSEE